MKIKILLGAIWLSLLSPIVAQKSTGSITLSGKVFSALTKKEVPFGNVVIFELKKRARINFDGEYSITIDKPGKYTIYVTADGLKTLKRTINLTQNIIKNFYLFTHSFKGKTVEIFADRKIQKLARYTMTVTELKRVPASFGDSLNALTALPGITKTNGFFGPLVIRGIDPQFNRYFVDGIPIFDPQHLGGLHSIIANDMMSEVDIFSSTAPAKYSGQLAGVIEINTLDKVEKRGGHADVGLLSITGLFKDPINIGNSDKTKPNGYWIASGRYGLIGIIEPLLKLISDNITDLPNYFDYQAKGKYFLGKSLSLTALLFGTFDTLDGKSPKLDRDSFEKDGVDPFISQVEFRNITTTFNQALTLKYNPSQYLENKLLVYSTITRIDRKIFIQGSFVDITQQLNANIFGFKNNFSLEYLKDFLTFDASIEYASYPFRATGKSVIPNGFIGNGNAIDLADTTAFSSIVLNEAPNNYTWGGFAQQEVKLGWLNIVPAVRIDYLSLTKDVTIDPRVIAVLDLPSETTISAAYGHYSSFFQTSPFVFTTAPSVASLVDALPEKAIHRTAGIQQSYLEYSLKVEGFYNTFGSLATPNGVSDNTIIGESNGARKAYGIEVMLKKSANMKRILDIFGWVNYTYTQSKEKTGLVADPLGDTWLDAAYENVHALKIILGVKYKSHELGFRFQYFTQFPNIPIVGDDGGIPFQRIASDNSTVNSVRFGPVYDTPKNQIRFAPNHQLDVRYTYQTTHTWGYVRFYVEVINIYGYQPIREETWKYNQPYNSASNPVLTRSNAIDSIPLPNFGVEVKF